VTVNVKGCDMVAITRGSVCGSTSTTIAGTVTNALAVAKLFTTEVAVTVTCRSLTGGAGAVYVEGAPLRVELGEMVPHGGDVHETVPVTAALALSFTSVAVRGSAFRSYNRRRGRRHTNSDGGHHQGRGR
jgi:hypothetical protein